MLWTLLCLTLDLLLNIPFISFSLFSTMHKYVFIHICFVKGDIKSLMRKEDINNGKV